MQRPNMSILLRDHCPENNFGETGCQRRHTSGQLQAKPSESAGTRPFTLHLAWDTELQEDLSSSA
ncbi:hypothetical protein QTO34_008956 [Cnephaeus nilssonii]|uniref:Uncharacterized protein n=1 Tax=Cnephaeus nilssonii TaxID=3371016 RepID=A0AA40HHV1_CNENI|nr:hypothetical protein QTO34_008956 [Eptesicus nilssonii]